MSNDVRGRSLFLLLSVLGVASCDRADPSAKVAAVPEPPEPLALMPLAAAAAPPPRAREHEARLLAIARGYKGYGRVVEKLNWGPTDCAAPRPPSPDKVHWSEAAKGAHGEKVYLLYASDLASYAAGADGKLPAPAPVGQTLVKESFEPVEVHPGDAGEVVDDHKLARKGEHLFKSGKPLGLFMMTKLDPKTPNTDEGWVYGVTDESGTAIVASGRVESCMTCHRNASNDRLFRKML